MTRTESRDASREEKRDRRGREAAGDGATSHSVKTFQFGKVGNAKKWTPSD